MALRKYAPSSDVSCVLVKSLSYGKTEPEDPQRRLTEADVDIDLREIYFLIMHFLSAGPCHRTFGLFWNELLEHQLLPRRYHALYSRSEACSGDEYDGGISFPLSYDKMVERNPHIEKDHLVKLLKQLILSAAVPSQGLIGGNALNAAVAPTLLGAGSFSLLTSDQNKCENIDRHTPAHMRWPHRLAHQVRAINLREIGGGFPRHHRAPSTRAVRYAIAKPSAMVQKLQIIKRIRGHRAAVYCAIFDRSGRYVITGSDDRLVKIWSMETACCLASCRGHEGDITDLAVNFNNTLVASASNDCIIRAWRLPDGLPISVLRGHTGAVTAIAFSPKPSAVYQLLSSSDDGTCRIWDARYSQFSPRIYAPKPSDSVAGRSNDSSSNTSQQSHQIFYCAFNATGTLFVTGSSDTLARVWNACKSSTDDLEQPNQEMDVLAGHENDVNFAQFSGCTVASPFSSSDALKEENIPKFRTTCFNHDNVVTCSCDGSAIIWIPRSRRSHGKVGRWVRAYHLKVPPPPMPTQPPLGGPRRRILPKPRGVNMMAWSLDNRFVLAAITDCRICVWNAIDGSLVHSLTGHNDSVYILDVHPFNPQIAMTAGYDGKTIVWDIWEGKPIRTYEIGQFKLVDGKFSPDGTSIILSDDVGQLYILSTGQGESQKDAKYDQFFLGDYRPLIQDIHGNTLDQETQLTPYQRNMQDLLCDSGMIPYPEPYQSMYQRRRLGALSIEWCPPSVRFAVGVDFGMNQGYQMLPIPDLEALDDPFPDFGDAMVWEPEIEMHSDDNDSEYHVTDDYSSGGELGSSSSDCGDPECSTDDGKVEDSHRDGFRKSKRKKRKVEVMISSGRRVKRKNLEENDVGSSGYRRSGKLRNGQNVPRKKSSLKPLRPQRAAARNALHRFSRVPGIFTDADVTGSDSNSSESVSAVQDSSFESEESEASLQNGWNKLSIGKEVSSDQDEDVDKPRPCPKSNYNTEKKRRFVLKLRSQNSSKFVSQQNAVYTSDGSQPDVAGPSSTAPQKDDEPGRNVYQDEGCIPDNADGDKEEMTKIQQPAKVEFHLNLFDGCKDGSVQWGPYKTRTSKQSKTGELLLSVIQDGSCSVLDQHTKAENITNRRFAFAKECQISHCISGIQNQDGDVDETVNANEHTCRTNMPESLEGVVNVKKDMDLVLHKCEGDESPTRFHEIGDSTRVPSLSCADGTPILTRSSMIHGTLSRACERASKIDRKSPSKEFGEDAWDLIRGSAKAEKHLDLKLRDDDGTRPDNVEHNGGIRSEAAVTRRSRSALEDQLKLDSYGRMFTAVYRRSNSSRGRTNPEGDHGSMEDSMSNSEKHNLDEETETPIDGVLRAASIRLRSTTHNLNRLSSNFTSKAACDVSESTPIDVPKASGSKGEENSCEGWRSGVRVAVKLRSARSRNSNCNIHDSSSLDGRKAKHSGKSSWLMLYAHEEGSQYIPQKGDAVVYLRQGHQEYISYINSREVGPWETIKQNIKAVEFCKVADLKYSTCPGSGESCCKMTLKFVDPSSDVVGKSFIFTLPEVTAFPDFLVERSRYDAAMERNWTSRDKCQVWWKNEGEEGGDWWEGRILTVKPKSFKFPDSPWERYVIKYKGDPNATHQHSPWELYDADAHWEQPRVDDDVKNKLLHAFAKLEQSGKKLQDYYGVNKLKQVSQKTNFVNRFPVPLSLEVIQSRLENNYYRSLEAMKHDIQVMLSNAESYLGRNAEHLKKLKRLSEWFGRTLSSL